MDKNTFWKVIDEVNSKVASTDQDQLLEETQKVLLALPSQEIAQWGSIQRHYCAIADTSGIYAAACLTNDFMSDDGFYDFRMWLISRGREVYMAALKAPDTLAALNIPEDTRFESYGYVAVKAYPVGVMLESGYVDSLFEMLSEEIKEHGKEHIHQIITTGVFQDSGITSPLTKGIYEQMQDAYYSFDFYDACEESPLTEAQKVQIKSEIELAPFEITSKDDLERYMPRMVEKYDGSGLRMTYNGQSIC